MCQKLYSRLRQEVDRSYDSSGGRNSMIESHLSQFTENQTLIAQIAATRLGEMADTVTSRMRITFQNLAKKHRDEPDAIMAASLSEVVAVIVSDIIEKLFARIDKHPVSMVQPWAVGYGQAYNPHALPGCDQLINPALAQMQAMSAFNFGSRQSQGFRTQPQTSVVSRKTASGATVEKRQEMCKGFLNGNCTYGNKCRYLHPAAESRAAQSKTIGRKIAQYRACMNVQHKVGFVFANWDSQENCRDPHRQHTGQPRFNTSLGQVNCHQVRIKYFICTHALSPIVHDA
ncbi:TPA: hypothetical protein ACH3X2_002531 [Trebouxia sp. C0005]